MIPRLGDGNVEEVNDSPQEVIGLENDSPSRGRKRVAPYS